MLYWMSRLLTMHLNNEEAYKFRYVLQTEIALTVTGIFVELIAEQSESLRIKRIQSEMGMTYNIIFFIHQSLSAASSLWLQLWPWLYCLLCYTISQMWKKRKKIGWVLVQKARTARQGRLHTMLCHAFLVFDLQKANH